MTDRNTLAAMSHQERVKIREQRETTSNTQSILTGAKDSEQANQPKSKRTRR